MRKAIPLLLALTAASPASAEIYRCGDAWTDKPTAGCTKMEIAAHNVIQPAPGSRQQPEPQPVTINTNANANLQTTQIVINAPQYRPIRRFDECHIGALSVRDYIDRRTALPIECGRRYHRRNR